jgi:hypothetical protein
MSLWLICVTNWRFRLLEQVALPRLLDLFLVDYPVIRILPMTFHLDDYGDHNAKSLPWARLSPLKQRPDLFF